MFRIGQRVVCVDDGTPFPTVSSPLTKGNVYTVRATDDRPHSKGQAIALAEIRVEASAPLLTGFFYSSRFRPVIERKTDTGMAILREILDRESHQDKAPKRERLITD